MAAKKKVKKAPQKVANVSTKKKPAAKKPEEKQPVAKKNNVEVCFSGSQMVGQNRVDYKVCKNPHYQLHLTTYGIKIEKQTVYEKKPVDVETTFLELVREKGENDQEYKARLKRFEHIQNQRSRGVDVEIPKEFKTQERQGTIRQIKDVEVVKELPKETKGETDVLDLYFLPFDHQIIELVTNYLNSKK